LHFIADIESAEGSDDPRKQGLFVNGSETLRMSSHSDAQILENGFAVVITDKKRKHLYYHGELGPAASNIDISTGVWADSLAGSRYVVQRAGHSYVAAKEIIHGPFDEIDTLFPLECGDQTLISFKARRGLFRHQYLDDKAIDYAHDFSKLACVAGAVVYGKSDRNTDRIVLKGELYHDAAAISDHHFGISVLGNAQFVGLFHGASGKAEHWRIYDLDWAEAKASNDDSKHLRLRWLAATIDRDKARLSFVSQERVLGVGTSSKETNKN
jgi:hypothetical protein